MKLLITLVVLSGLWGCGATDESPDAPSRMEVRTEALEPFVCGSTQPVHTFAGIYLAGQPSGTDFELAEADGVRTVINLRMPQEQEDFDEAGIVTGLGMTYISLPWNGPDALTDDVFDRAREMFNTAERPMMVHCGSANRVGAVWIPWRVLDGGVSFEAALTEARTMGLRTPAYIDRARSYIGEYGAR
tara:strand:+ start:7388 stop:7951 length:564 start_codon:yes stop_codon:yes gene_type:complete